mmetsp:Transcript_14504/g.18319  ORF Transcript_14504/g.18319 Transcript_14504/m.18319 type:complete len:168 (-) Transcript_14504:295-798(-)|eukprot:CAMPEP_0203634794 /NCGR_PEP_ID=MMETSP0088-20131115/1677_1 /ASSEMBLY_ACC=CAM_ASM_001087 /TAXON_ID=426623 /ORGANISM="Chaetoceros affinis, Strain CCMP159" /LENGTH=167 /DNA_ID=CAMNT_0050488475 /DNA_START=95 /DNA_END=598 /DNA_ORIENTATION=-
MSFTARTVVRRLAHRSVDWSSPHFKSNPEISAAVSSFRAWAASAEAMAEKYSAPPTPVDFASAKSSVRDKALVEAFESFYASASPAAEVYEWSADDKADKAQQIEDAKGRLAFTLEMIEETEAELEFMKANRTTRDTSVSDIKEAYPDIAEETEKEIEERKWFKDVM